MTKFYAEKAKDGAEQLLRFVDGRPIPAPFFPSQKEEADKLEQDLRRSIRVSNLRLLGYSEKEIQEGTTLIQTALLNLAARDEFGNPKPSVARSLSSPDLLKHLQEYRGGVITIKDLEFTEARDMMPRPNNNPPITFAPLLNATQNGTAVPPVVRSASLVARQ